MRPAPPEIPARLDALGDPLPPGATARLGSNRLRHRSSVVGLAFAPDGHSLVSVGAEGDLLEWAVPNGKLLRTIDVPREPTRALSASGDLSVIGLARPDGDARIVDGLNGRLSPLADGLGLGSNVLVSPDRRWLALWGRPWSAVSILPVGGGPARPLHEAVVEYLGVAFDAGGTRVALLGRQADGPESRTTHALLSLRDPASDEVLWRAEVPSELLHSAAFSADGRRLYAGDGHGNVRSFDASSGELLATWPLFAPDEVPYVIESLAVSPDGQRLAATHGRSAVVLDTRSGSVLATLGGHGGAVNAVAYSPAGDLVATACADLVVRLFDPSDGRLVSAPGTHASSLTQVLCAPDGRSICTIGSDGLCLLWPGDASGPPRELARIAAGRVSAAYSADGATLAVCAAEPAVSLFDVASGQLRARWDTGLAGPAAFVAFAPDGSALATVHVDEKVRIWPLAAGLPATAQPSVTTPGVEGIPGALAWLPDGRIAVATSQVRLIDPKTGATVRKLIGKSPISNLAYTRDGRMLAAANADRTATIYTLDAASAAEGTLESLGEHASRVYAVAFSPDGALLATGGGGEGLIRIWDVASGAEIAQLDGHEVDVRSLAFTADGRMLLSAGTEAAALAWSMPPKRAEAEAAGSPSR